MMANKTKTKNTESAGGVVLNRNGEVLVVKQRDSSWSLPKGHIEDNETKIEAAKREIKEESGITKLDFVKELGCYKRYRIWINGGDNKSELKTIYMFLFKTDQDILKPSDPHNPEAKWVNQKDVESVLTHRKDKNFFQKVWKKELEQ